ncbi:tyrosine-type recombinase/integrase [Vibrio sp. YMD68]|uniref:tyrosine-type recombinase/integrase n=1 Tax=Vibrio sp. YMD68 TaxID=3042300 RepID=UPI00249A512F|nr:tyrosine-type recombinase/integrase [Vibrio sp. YMD68]WGV98122.1 tyrosine-type recombinase/integrase [Vibrio sp. YMD68]
MQKKIPQVTDKRRLNDWRSTFGSQVTLEEFDMLTHGVYSRNSLLAMVKDWNLFSEFCQIKQVSSLPASVTVVRLFIEREAKKRKFSTLKRYAVTLSLVHRLLYDTDPVSNSLIRQLLASYRMEKFGDAKQAQGLTLNHIKELDRILTETPSPKSVRDLAIYYVMFECALKRSDLKSLSFSDLTECENHYLVSIKDHSYELSHRCSSILKLWLSVAGDNPDLCLFRAIDRHGNVSSAQMDDSSIYRVLASASDLLNLSVKFSGQSTRVGAAQHLASRGKKAKDIQEFGRWLSPAMPYQYMGLKQTAEDEKRVYKIIKPWE